MDLAPELFASIQKSGVAAHFEIDVPADKDVFLETGVYDLETGKAGTLEVSLPVDSGGTKAATDASGANAKPDATGSH